MEYLTREKVEGHHQQSKEDWWDCLFCEMQHKGFPYKCPNRVLREDGRVERLCKHGIGHTISVPPQKDEEEGKAWFIHGCDGCCKSYRKKGWDYYKVGSGKKYD